MVFKKDLELQKDWVSLLYKLKDITGKRPADLNSVLFLMLPLWSAWRESS